MSSIGLKSPAPPPTASTRARSHARRVTLWSLAWALSIVSASAALPLGWTGTATALVTAALSAFFGLATLLAYRRLLADADELRRKIEVDSLAFAFGSGAIGGLTYWLLFIHGLVTANGFVFIFVLMLVMHAAGVMVGCRRYS